MRRGAGVWPRFRRRRRPLFVGLEERNLLFRGGHDEPFPQPRVDERLGKSVLPADARSRDFLLADEPVNFRAAHAQVLGQGLDIHDFGDVSGKRLFYGLALAFHEFWDNIQQPSLFGGCHNVRNLSCFVKKKRLRVANFSKVHRF